MKYQDKEYIISKYEKRLNIYGVSADSVCWENRELQKLRFSILYEIGITDNMSILDVGCGFGDFFSFIREKGDKIIYTGIDISKQILAQAKLLHPHLSFNEIDILHEDIDKQFDYVVCSGALNHIAPNNIHLVKRFVDRTLLYARYGVAFNLSSIYNGHYYYDDVYYYNPADVFTECIKLCKNVIIRHDYNIADFTVYCYK